MIKDILFPKQLGSYFLFARNRVGIDITDEAIHVTKMSVKAEKRTVTLSFTQKIEVGTLASAKERTVAALKAAMSRVGSYDEVISTVSSSGIIFKELELPFLDREKIAQVVTFEVEPLLPFSVDKAVIDFIITKQNKKNKSSYIMVAAAPHTIIENHLAICAQANINPDVVSVDMFALYGYIQTVSGKKKQFKQLIINIDTKVTTLSFFEGDRLRLIRTLGYGTTSIIEKLSKKNDISFTIQSVFGSNKGVHSIFTSRKEDIFAIAENIAKQIECTFDIWKFSTNKIIKIKRSVSISPQQIISLALALPNMQTDSCNLRQKEFTKKTPRLFFYQSITALILLLASTVMLVWHYKTQVNKLHKEITQSEQEVIEILQKEFNIPEDFDTFDDIIEEAEAEANKKRETWLAFSNQARSSFLQYLLELVTKIDVPSLDFKVERIVIEQDRLLLQASVRDYEALKILERELRKSPLFSYVEPQDNPSFTMSITLARIGEDT